MSSSPQHGRKRLARPLVAVLFAVAPLVPGSSFAETDLELEAAVPAMPAPIRSAPRMSREAEPAVRTEALHLGDLMATAPREAPKPADVPWVLSPEQHPWPLHYTAPPRLNSLVIDIPSVAEARLMLPGRAADTVDRARAAVSKYINDAVGMGAQARGRQADQLNDWMERTALQLRDLPADPWPQYQFNQQARRVVLTFKEALDGQSTESVQWLIHEVTAVVERITPVMELMPTYELSMAWYNILVQLRNGVAMYQAQVGTADAHLQARTDAFLQQYPALPQPMGEPPTQARPGAAPLAPPVLAATNITQPLTKPAPSPELSQTAASDGNWSGTLIVLSVLAGIAWFFVRLRKQVSVSSKSSN